MYKVCLEMNGLLETFAVSYSRIHIPDVLTAGVTNKVSHDGEHMTCKGVLYYIVHNEFFPFINIFGASRSQFTVCNFCYMCTIHINS